MSAISDQRYVEVQAAVGVVASMLIGDAFADLGDFIERADRAQGLGPILLPSEWRAASDKLDEVLVHARALRDARHRILKAVDPEEHGE